MERYFGFRVRVSDFLEPEDYKHIGAKVASFLENSPTGETQYRVYLHQLVLEAPNTKFGISGGLSARVSKIFLRFSINKKQRKTGDIKFINYLFEGELRESVDHYYLPNIIGYTLDSSYFSQGKEYFQNTIITLVRLGMREQHKKIKILVSVEPTPQFLEVLRRSDQIDAETFIDLDFTKARQFNRQTRLFISSPEPVKNFAKSNSEEKMPKTLITIGQVGTLISDSNGPITSNVNLANNSVLTEHLIHELKILSKSIQEDPPAGIAKRELEVVDTAIENPADPTTLKRLADSGKWLMSRVDKVGLALLTEYLKHQTGV